MNWICRGLTKTNQSKYKPVIFQNASDLMRSDKVSESLTAHFWGSKLLMITVRLSARHWAPAEPLLVVKVTNPRGGGGEERGRRGELNIMVNMRHQWFESNKSNQELSINTQWCWMFWDWNVQRQHNQNSAQTQASRTTLYTCAHYCWANSLQIWKLTIGLLFSHLWMSNLVERDDEGVRRHCRKHTKESQVRRLERK